MHYIGDKKLKGKKEMNKKNPGNILRGLWVSAREAATAYCASVHGFFVGGNPEVDFLSKHLQLQKQKQKDLIRLRRFLPAARTTHTRRSRGAIKFSSIMNFCSI